MCTHKHLLLFTITFDFYVLFIKYLRWIISNTVNNTNMREEELRQENSMKFYVKNHKNLHLPL